MATALSPELSHLQPLWDSLNLDRFTNKKADDPDWVTGHLYIIAPMPNDGYPAVRDYEVWSYLPPEPSIGTTGWLQEGPVNHTEGHDGDGLVWKYWDGNSWVRSDGRDDVH